MLLYFCLISLGSPKVLFTANEWGMILSEGGDTIQPDYYDSTDVE